MKFVRRQLFIILCIALSLIAISATPRTSFAQTEDATSELSEADLVLQGKLKSPTETFRTFFSAMESGDLETARTCLDLNELGPEVAVTKGNIYADRLYQVLNQLWDRSFWRLPSQPDSPSPFILADHFPVEVDQAVRDDGGEIQLIKNSKGMWRFSQSTLTTIDESLWNKWHDPSQASLSIPVWLEKNLPPWTLDKWFLLKNYQWACLLTLVITGFAIGFVVRKLLDLLTSMYLAIRRTEVPDRSRNILWQPIGLLAHAATWYYGSRLFDLPVGFQNLLFNSFRFFAVVALVWTAFRLIDLFLGYLQRRAAQSENRYDDTLGPIIGSGLKIASVIAGIILMVNFLGWEDWGAVLGGFGVGGIAIAIAAKDVIGNFFGSLTVLSDRPFEIGDWVVVDDKVEGTVERVGIRSSRIRTFHQSEAIVPNSILTNAVVDNMGRRRFRRFKISLSLNTQTAADALDAYCEKVREILSSNSYVRQESFHVNVYDITESAIVVLVYCFLDCDDWQIELDQRHHILTNSIRQADLLGISFANSIQAMAIPSHPSLGTSHTSIAAESTNGGDDGLRDSSSEFTN